MSTRCEVLIQTQDGEQHKYYHHHDGYPWGVGWDLTQKIMQYPKRFSSENMLRTILTHDYEPEALTVEHGDSEFFYYIKSTENGITLKYAERKPYNFEPDWKWKEDNKMFFMRYVSHLDEYVPEYLSIT